MIARCIYCGFDSDDAYEAASHLRLHEGEKVNEAALKDLIRSAVALNLKAKTKAKS